MKWIGGRVALKLSAAICTSFSQGQMTKPLPKWFGRSGPSPYLSMKLKNFGCGDTDILTGYMNGRPVPPGDDALVAYVQAFKDFRHGRLEERILGMVPRNGKTISKYQVSYLSVALLIALDIPGQEGDQYRNFDWLIREKSGADTVQTPLGYLILGCYLCHYSYATARPILAQSVKRFPNVKGLWDVYTWDCESGEMSNGGRFDPNSPAYGYRAAVEARRYMSQKWPDDDYNRISLAQDLDMLGSKTEAIRLTKEVIKRHPSMDTYRKDAERFLKYYMSGGFKS